MAYDLDAVAEKGFDPIEITLKGTTYTVGTISEDLTNRIAKCNTMAEQLGLLVNAKPAAFVKEDIRLLTRAVNYIMDEIQKQSGIDPKLLAAADSKRR